LSKKRLALKFVTAGAVTSVYALAVQQAWSGNHAKVSKKDAKEVAIVAGALTVATWIAVLA
jgi:hypothetical protein